MRNIREVLSLSEKTIEEKREKAKKSKMYEEI